MSGFDINQTSISGNLTADPDLRSTKNGTQLCRLRLAHNESRKDASGDYVDVPGFYDVTVWGGFGEYLAKHLTKGEKIVVSGRLHWREFEDSQKNKRQAVEIIADTVIPVPKASTAPASTPEPTDRRDEDIPF